MSHADDGEILVVDRAYEQARGVECSLRYAGHLGSASITVLTPYGIDPDFVAWGPLPLSRSLYALCSHSLRMQWPGDSVWVLVCPVDVDDLGSQSKLCLHVVNQSPCGARKTAQIRRRDLRGTALSVVRGVAVASRTGPLYFVLAYLTTPAGTQLTQTVS